MLKKVITAKLNAENIIEDKDELEIKKKAQLLEKLAKKDNPQNETKEDQDDSKD